MTMEIQEGEQCWGAFTLFVLENLQFLYWYYSHLCTCLTFGKIISLKRKILFISIFVYTKTLDCYSKHTTKISWLYKSRRKKKRIVTAQFFPVYSINSFFISKKWKTIVITQKQMTSHLNISRKVICANRWVKNEYSV